MKPKNKSYKKFDGEGLYLEVMPNGNKLWRLKYYYLKKEKRISFGSYPLITLVQAREKRRESKLLLKEGKDPSFEKRLLTSKAIRENQLTFKNVALEWHNMKKESWSSKYSKTVLNRLETNLFPFIGNQQVNDIHPSELLCVLRKIEDRGAIELAGRVRQICSQVFRYSIITGYCKNDISSPLVGAMKTRKTKHFASINAKEIPELLNAIEKNDARIFARTRRAIMLSLLTFVRPGELRQARWADISFEKREWLIPAQYMKSKRDHLVPLSIQSLRILKAQEDETEHITTPWVFPSQIRPKNPMSDGTVNVALKNLGFKGRMTAHGFRALARTTIREDLEYLPDIIEAQLAHKPSGPLGAAYDRSQFLRQRKAMMQDWANFICAN